MTGFLSPRRPVLHVPFCYPPDPVGGTEVYVQSLIRELQPLGIASLVAAPGPATVAYEHGGTRVHRFRIAEEMDDVSELYGVGDPGAAMELDGILAEERPGLVHMHAFTRGVSLRLARAAKARGIPVVLTYHTPTVTCLRGMMMLWGRAACDGVLRIRRCASCTLHGRGLNMMAALLVGSLPPGLGHWLGRLCGRGGHLTALRMTELTSLRHAATRSLFAEVDHIVAVCDWVRQVLLRNGVPDRKLTLCRQGVGETAMPHEEDRSLEGLQGFNVEAPREALLERPDPNSAEPFSEARSREAGTLNSQTGSLRRRPSPLRVAFFGRMDPVKGVHVLLQAFRQAYAPDATLDIYGVSQGQSGDDYRRRLEALASGDLRIRFLPPVASDEMVRRLRGYVLLAVPSLCLETGPLVVLDAFAAGVPVLGSALGGVAELVRHGIDGWLVETGSVNAWRDGLERLAGDQDLVASLRAGVKPPRTMATVAGEMAGLYSGLLASRAELPRDLRASV